METKDLEKLTDDERQQMLDAETQVYSRYFEGGAEDRKPTQLAILAAILLHVFILYVTFPQFKMQPPSLNPNKIIYVREWRPPPPPQKEPPKPIKERKLKTKKIPIPDPTPEEPEPIKEPEPEPEPEPLPPDAIALIGTPAPPPVGATGPLFAGVNGVTNPVAIEKPEPTYPELARKAGIPGKVFLQAVIGKDGMVKDVSVISVNAPKMGFEDAAVEAVRRWRYKPAEQNGHPVEVYFTVALDFTID
ncbi:MAG: energy transducer TonB [Acidobacteriota bacterium]